MRKSAQELVEIALDEYLMGLSEDDLVAVWNEYCMDCNDPDDMVYENDSDELEEMLGDMDAWDIMCKVVFGNWHPMRKWVWFDGYANLVSSDYLVDEQIFISDMVRHIIDNDEDFGDSEIRRILDGEGDEDDDRYASRRVRRAMGNRRPVEKRAMRFFLELDDVPESLDDFNDEGDELWFPGQDGQTNTPYVIYIERDADGTWSWSASISGDVPPDGIHMGYDSPQEALDEMRWFVDHKNYMLW